VSKCRSHSAQASKSAFKVKLASSNSCHIAGKMSDATGLAGQVSVGSQPEMQPQVPGGMQVRSPHNSNVHLTSSLLSFVQHKTLLRPRMSSKCNAASCLVCIPCMCRSVEKVPGTDRKYAKNLQWSVVSAFLLMSQVPQYNPAGYTQAMAQQLQQQSIQLRMFWEQQHLEIQQVGTDPAEFKNHQLPLARIKKVAWSNEKGMTYSRRLYTLSC